MDAVRADLLRDLPAARRGNVVDAARRRRPRGLLKKQPVEVEFSTILVPVFGTKLDDDIVATAGRLADAELEEGEVPPRLDVVYVAELLLTVPLDSPLSTGVRGRRCARAGREVGDEYENLEVTTNLIRARSIGSGIVQEARDKGAEVIVMGGEPPTRIRGGAILGGIGGARPRRSARSPSTC